MATDTTSPDAVLKLRAVVPRWKPPRQSIEPTRADVSTLERRRDTRSSWIKRLQNSYNRAPSPLGAVDLYETASLLGGEKVLSAELLLATPAARSEVYRSAATMAAAGAAIDVGNVDAHVSRSAAAIRLLRTRIRAQGGTPFAWSELARNYLIVGEPSKSIRAMRTALQLAPANTYLYRSATRLYVHTGELELALTMLREIPEVRHNPRLLSAEIATSTIARRSSKLIDAGSALLLSRGIIGQEESELASAIGTIELLHGDTKKARARFRSSLSAPTENALAQAQWANEQDPKIIIPTSAWDTPDSHEASTLRLRHAMMWTAALQECAAWLASEPFSARAALIGSFIAFRPEDKQLAEKFATAGLIADPNSVALLNNRALARIYLGKPKEAIGDIRNALHQDKGRANPALLATLGLLAYRSGLPDVARLMYAKALGWLAQDKLWSSVARGYLHLAREELRVGAQSASEWSALSRRIAESAMAASNPELVGLARLVIDEASKAGGERSPGQENAGEPHFEISQADFVQLEALFRVPSKVLQSSRRALEYAKLAVSHV